MHIIHNPAKARPLSANVKKLMRFERESPRNPNVYKVGRVTTTKDLLYCDMQGSIFMAALDKEIAISEFAPAFMTSQLAGVIDNHFSIDSGREDSPLAFLQMPLLLKSPETIVDVLVWINDIIANKDKDEQPFMALARAFSDDDTLAEITAQPDSGGDGKNAVSGASATGATTSDPSEYTSRTPSMILGATYDEDPDITALADEYEYAYWLGYIYRYECLMHAESSRMVYGAFNEAFMRSVFTEVRQTFKNRALVDCAGAICRMLDEKLIGKLWR